MLKYIVEMQIFENFELETTFEKILQEADKEALK